MAIVVLQHDARDPVANLGRILSDIGHSLRIIRLNEGDALPSDLDEVEGLISLGGPMNVDEADQHPWMADEMAMIRQAHDTGVPVVGICLGAQLIAAALGGEVAKMPQEEIGWHELQLAFPGTMDVMYAGMPWKTMQFHAHAYEVTKLPPGAVPLAGSKLCRNQAFKVGFKTYGFQYHFEWNRRELDAWLDAVSARAGQGGFGSTTDLNAIRDQMDTHYGMYRHLSDRLCGNIATFLFAIDKHVGHHATIEPVANFHPSTS